jgi:hypothetical protein
MTEPTVEPTPVEAPAYEPWSVAVDLVCAALETYAMWRFVSGDIAECARLARISPATAARFERALDALSDPEDDATPSQARPEVAKAPTQ